MKTSLFKEATILTRGFICLIFLSMISLSGFSQNAGISPAGAVAPDAAAGLDVNFNTKGLLIPRVALTSTTSFAPLATHVAGMMVYNTVTIGDVTPGFYYNNGIKWVAGLPKANAAGDMQYWDGTTWKNIPTGSPGQRLQVNGSGVPAWAP
jgi:hypothetical protein